MNKALKSKNGKENFSVSPFVYAIAFHTTRVQCTLQGSAFESLTHESTCTQTRTHALAHPHTHMHTHTHTHTHSHPHSPMHSKRGREADSSDPRLLGLQSEIKFPNLSSSCFISLKSVFPFLSQKCTSGLFSVLLQTRLN